MYIFLGIFIHREVLFLHLSDTRVSLYNSHSSTNPNTSCVFSVPKYSFYRFGIWPRTILASFLKDEERSEERENDYIWIRN